MKILNQVLLSLLCISSLLGTGCNGGSAAPPQPTPTYSCTNCTIITPENFVAALVQLGQTGTIAAGYANSTLVKDTTARPGQNGGGYFIIWNGETQSYQAVQVVNNALAAVTSACIGMACSDVNPQSAAEAFVNAPPTPVSGPPITTTTTGSQTTTTSTSGNVLEGETYLGYIGTPSVDYVEALPVTPTGQLDNQGQMLYQDPFHDGYVYSQTNATRDTDLQQSQLQQTSQLTRAAQLSAGLQMNFSSAVQLTQLADSIQAIQAKQTQLTSDDRTAVMQQLQGIAGVTQDELSQAVQGALQGDMTASNAMVEKISQNLGMPAGSLKDKILPKLGLNLNE